MFENSLLQLKVFTILYKYQPLLLKYTECFKSVFTLDWHFGKYANVTQCSLLLNISITISDTFRQSSIEN